MPRSNIRTVCTHDHECFLLAVDDDKNILGLFEEIFDESTGIRLITADSLAKALAIIANTPNIEAVLLDLRLGDSDGIETLKAVAGAVEGRTAIIAISGSHELEDDAMNNGAIDFWGKPPVLVDMLARTKYAILNQRKINYWRKRCIHYESRLEVIEGDVKTDPEKALEELEMTRLELKADVQALMMRAN